MFSVSQCFRTQLSHGWGGYIRKANSFSGGTSRASQMAKTTSRDTAQSAVSIRLMWVRLTLIRSARRLWEIPPLLPVVGDVQSQILVFLELFLPHDITLYSILFRYDLGHNVKM